MNRRAGLEELKVYLSVQSGVADVLAASPSIAEATPKFLEVIAAGLDWDWGELWQVDRSADFLRCVAVWHRPDSAADTLEAQTRSMTFRRGEGVPGAVWVSGQPFWIADLPGCPQGPRAKGSAEIGVRSAVGFPIAIEGEVLAIMLFATRNVREPDRNLIRLLGALGSQIGQFIGRKRAEDNLRRGKESLAEAQRVAHVGSWEWRPVSGELTWSDEAYRIFGYQPGAFAPTYERFIGLVHPDDQERVRAAVHAAIHGNEAYGIDHRLIRVDGEVRYARSQGSVTFDAEGKVLRMVGTIQDVTDRARAEAERTRLLEQERAVARIAQSIVQDLSLSHVVEAIMEQTRTVLEADVVGVWLADPDRRELWIQAFSRKSPATVAMLRHLTYDSPTLTAQAAATRQPQICQNPQAGAGKLTMTVEISRRENVQTVLAMPLISRGSLVGVATYAWRKPRDISAADLEFNTTVANLFAVMIANASLYDQVKENLRVREEFMAGVAHALRTPVTVIKGSSQFAVKIDAREPMARQTLEQVVRQADRISAIIDDLLNVMRLRQGTLRLHYERVDLSALARDVVGQMNRIEEEDRVHLTVDAPILVEADRGLIRRVLVRIMENALLYSPKGAAVEVAVIRDDGHGTVSVTDRGPGIPPERQRHVFEPFYESVPAGSPGYVGIVSLGLYLSRQLVDALGGRISLRSEPGHGATFAVSLPLEGGKMKNIE